jgi:uncharacterized protein (TIGR03000 family)
MAAVLAAGTLAMVVSPVDARPQRGGRGGGHVGGFRGGRGAVGFHAAHVGGFRGFRGGFYGARRGYYGRSFYGRGYYGRGYGWYGGYLPYYGYGSYYPSYYYDYDSYVPYYDLGTYLPDYSYSDAYADYTPYGVASSEVSVVPGAAATTVEPRQAADNRVHLLFIVQANAEVWIEDYKTKQTGTRREYVSPELSPGKAFAYTVRVVTPNSDETRTIRVKANDKWSVDFTKPAPRPKQ